MTIPGNDGKPSPAKPKAPRKRLLVFNDPQPLRIDRPLAKEIGFLESLILLQLEYHISTTDNLRDGEYWTYQTLADLQSWDFPWLSMATISRTLTSLEQMGLIKKRSYNRRKSDRTLWYALNYEGISVLQSLSVGQDATILQNANWMLHTDKTILQNEISILQDDTALPNHTPKKNTKESPESSGVLPAALAEKTDSEKTDSEKTDPPTALEKFRQSPEAQQFDRWRQGKR